MKRLFITAVRALRLPLYARKIARWWHEATLPAALSIGAGTVIDAPFHCGNPQNIRIGEDCHIGRGCDFGVVDASFEKGRGNDGKILIGNRVWITEALQIYSACGVAIEDDCMLASRIFIVDYTHGYSRIDLPYQHQPFEAFGAVTIGRGSWIGQNVVILQGVTIGEMSIVGANSVVTRSLPPFCIAAGAPARVIKLWDATAGEWKPSRA